MAPPNAANPTQLSSKPTFINQLTKYRLLSYKKNPTEKWKTWVHILKPKFQDIWKKAGIYDAILASTHKIPRHKNLIINLAMRWCGGRNTFIFPWGEVTITLEDIINLGSYSVLGVSVSTPLPKELNNVLICMKKVRREASVTNAIKWMEYFMCSGKQIEHEAFLAFWLSKFDLVHSNDYISIQHLRIAIHLSQGTMVALAPLVLASIYRDMSLLRQSLIDSRDLTSIITLRSVNHPDLVHMWAWERFPELCPVPNAMEREEPRSARWNGVTTLNCKDVRAVFDSAEQSFLWCPYEKCEKSKSTAGKQIEPDENVVVNQVNYLEADIVNTEEANIVDTQPELDTNILKLEEANVVDTGKQIEQAENPVVTEGNYEEVNVVNAEEGTRDNGTFEVPQLELETHALRPKEVNIVDAEEQRCDKITSEAPKLELKTRILRLEMIIDIIKTAKHAPSSKGKI